jgi:FkbM family methyltransferase
MKGDAKDIIQQYIYYFGVWEPHITAFISRRLTSGDTFVDVGANIGYYSLLASRLVGASGTVVAIEASPRIFSKLRANLALNGVSNVRAVNLAASECEGSVKIFRGHEHHIGLTTIIEDRGFELECEVGAAPLSSILRPEEVRNARLVKIDVEGAEWLVVCGMASLINKGRRDLDILIEVDTDRLAHQGKTPDDLLRPFLTGGFHPYAVQNDYSALSYIPPPPYKRPERIRSPIRGVMDLVLSRQEGEYL